MQIIVLRGKSNKGKTTTLNFVYDMISNMGANLIDHKETLGKNPYDFKSVVKFNGKKIAFFTMGDYSQRLVEAIYGYEKLNCDILICAISTNNRKVRANKALNELRFNTIPIEKQVSEDKKLQMSLNQSDADEIIKSL